MEHHPTSPKLTFRQIVRGLLRGVASIGGGMERIGDGERRVAEGMSRISLQHSVEVSPQSDHTPRDEQPSNQGRTEHLL